jgi:hypothetical protein
MTNDMSTPQNELEVALFAAADDAAARPNFYKVLCESSVLIPHVGDGPEIVDGVVREASKISLPNIEIQGKMHVPFFSSEIRLAPGTRYLGMRALDLFSITKGSHLVLNPGSGYGKLFVPSEISGILDGSLFTPTETFVAKKGTQQLIGQPKQFPHDFVNALSRFFAGEPTVESAFLAQHFIAGTHTEPALLVAVAAPEGDFERVAAAIGIISRETDKVQTSVDIIRLGSDSRGYFSNQTPFYARKKRGFLGRLFG